MAKVHFFKLAQELGVRPVDLQKKLAAGGIAVQSTSTMLDEPLVQHIREFLHKDITATVVAAEPVAAPQPAPESIPPVVPTPAALVPPAVEPTPQAAPEQPVSPPEPRQVTRVIKRTPEGTTVQRAEPKPSSPPPPSDKARKGTSRQNLLIDTTEGGLSPDADFGIVKAAGIVPIPPPRPARPPRREGEGMPAPPQQGSRPAGRPGEGRPPQGGPRPPRGPMGNGPAPAAPAETPGAKPPAKGAPARSADAKKKQKRTVFSDKEKERSRLAPTRTAGMNSTVIRSRRKRRGEGGKQKENQVLEEPVIITGHITVNDLATLALVTPAQIISQLIGMGVLATINQMIEPEHAVAALEKLNIEAIFEKELVEQAAWRLSTTSIGSGTTGTFRPPVVTILGHVDHGKTTLLDSIRNTHVTAQEFGGITQHIGAYQVVINDQKITFLDTPGHAAFTAMRARGANLTDIAVLVVAADDGVQPQTIEAIDHAKAANVPIIVAINKIDLPDAQPELVKQELTRYDLVSEEWGGKTIFVPLSAKKAQNIDQLLDTILLVAEIQELRAEADQPAQGAVVESKLDKQRGPVATILVQSGTLHVGDALVVGMVSGKIRAMNDDHGRPIKEAGPSTPVEITGLSVVPVAGDLFEVVVDERKAREIAETRQLKARDERLQAHVSLQNLSSMVASGQVKDLNLVVKSDVAGSIEAISHALNQVEQGEIRVNLIHAGVGDITESDVLLASASNAIIVGFHVRIEQQARQIAEETGIDVRVYQVIYDLVDDIEKAMLGMLAPIYEEAVLGHAEVRAVFKVTRLGIVAGCYVKDGLVRRGSKLRVRRNGEVVFEGLLDSLKHLKEDVREMAQGYECGISVSNYSAWDVGDIIESYVIKELRRETL